MLRWLADRNNSRAIGTLFRPSSSVTWCIVTKRCILEQKLLFLLSEVVYEKSIGTKMNDLDLRLEVVSRSRQTLRYVRRWISRKPSEIEAWFQRTTNKKWHMGYQMVTRPMTSRDPKGAVKAVQSAILATTWLLVFFTKSTQDRNYRALPTFSAIALHYDVHLRVGTRIHGNGYHGYVTGSIGRWRHVGRQYGGKWKSGEVDDIVTSSLGLGEPRTDLL